ncbi:MAG: PKD domain-containing protein, partial [Bacteroidota bacterium]
MRKSLLAYLCFIFPLIVISQTVEVKIDGFVFDAQTGEIVTDHPVWIEAVESTDFAYDDTVYTTLEGYFTASFQVPQSASAVFFVYTYDCQEEKQLYTLQLSDGQIEPSTVEFAICRGELACKARFSFRKEAPSSSTYTFQNESRGSYSSILWELGDNGELGRFENEDEVSFTFPDEGEYAVQLIIFDEASGCNDTSIQYVFVKNDLECFVSFSYQPDGSELGRVFFSGYGSNDFVEWKWEFWNGEQAFGPVIDYVFPGPGAYLTCLRGVDAYGCEAFYCDTVYVGEPADACEARFEPEKLESKRYKFIDRSEIPNPDGVQYKWLFGDGGSSTEREPEHAYENYGVYEVCLNIYDEQGCESAECYKILVSGENVEDCQASFEYEAEQDDPSTIQFY